MLKSTRRVLISASLILILVASPWGVVTATVASGAAGTVTKAVPFVDSVYYAAKLTSSQPSPFCPTSLGVIVCYTPQDIRAAYDYPSYLDGTGQTIVIIDAFGSPTVQADLNTFDSAFGLPSTTIQIVCQNSKCPVVDLTSADQLSWTTEIALDTQYAHAMAPGAHIVLFVATSDDDLVLEQAVQQAVTMFPHSIVSQSFGDPELDLKQGTCTVAPVVCNSAYVQKVFSVGEAAYKQAAQEGTTVFASAGDYGADNSPISSTFTSANPSYPSSSPQVTAVGGTMGSPYFLGSTPACKGFFCSTGLVTFLNTPSCGLSAGYSATATCTPIGYGQEQVWNEPAIGAATGGAPSLYFNVPSYQQGLGLKARATPDVSYNAAVDGGVFGYWSAVSASAGFYIFGGTSAGSPQWSAIAALADQLAANFHQPTIGFINPVLYEIGNNPLLYFKDFHDTTTGNNIIAGSPDNVGFSAHQGWDDASGWGTPNVALLVSDLVLLSSQPFQGSPYH